MASLVLLLALFRFEKDRPSLRSRLLSFSLGAEVATWIFLGSSLLFCRAFLGLYDSGMEGEAISVVFGLSILASVAVAVPLSALVTIKVPREMATRLERQLPPARGVAVEMGTRMAGEMGMPAVRMLQSAEDVPFAYSVGGPKCVTVLSAGLLARLEEDEVETVIAHELAHVKNHDTGLSTTLAVCRRVLFLDPLVRAMERAFYAEKEFSADEFSARKTGKPLSLASALLKIGSAVAPIPGGNVEGLSILGAGQLKPPSLEERVERLVRLAKELDREKPWAAMSVAA